MFGENMLEKVTVVCPDENISCFDMNEASVLSDSDN
jgi:hypothetical protein